LCGGGDCISVGSIGDCIDRGRRRSQIELPATAVRWRDDEEYAPGDGTGVMERCGRGRVDGTTPTTNK